MTIAGTFVVRSTALCSLLSRDRTSNGGGARTYAGIWKQTQVSADATRHGH
jgi:hypothetical protein